MAAFLRDTNDSQSVIDIFNRLTLNCAVIFLFLSCQSFLQTTVPNFQIHPGLNSIHRGISGHICFTVILLRLVRKDLQNGIMN